MDVDCKTVYYRILLRSNVSKDHHLIKLPIPFSFEYMLTRVQQEFADHELCGMYFHENGNLDSPEIKITSDDVCELLAETINHEVFFIRCMKRVNYTNTSVKAPK